MEDRAVNVRLLSAGNATSDVNKSKLVTERSKLERMCQQFQDKLVCVVPFRLLPDSLREEYRNLRKSKEVNVRLFAILLLGIATKCRDTFLLSRRIMCELIDNAPVRDSGIGQQTYNGFISMLLTYGILVCLEKPTRNKAGSYKLVNEVYANLVIDGSQLIEKVEVQENAFESSDCEEDEPVKVDVQEEVAAPNVEVVDDERPVDKTNSDKKHIEIKEPVVEVKADIKEESSNDEVNNSSSPDNKLSESVETKPSSKTPPVYKSLKRHLGLVRTALKDGASPLDANLFNHGVTDDPDMTKYFNGIVVDWFEKINGEDNPDTKFSLYKTFASVIVGELQSYEGLKAKEWEPSWVFKGICEFWSHDVGWFATPKGERLNRPITYLYAIVKSNWKSD